MGDSLEEIIMKYVPETWLNGNGCVLVDKMSEEFKGIVAEISKNSFVKIKTMKRYENIYDYGQFLFREQHILKLNPNTIYYRLSRFKNSGVSNNCFLKIHNFLTISIH